MSGTVAGVEPAGSSLASILEDVESEIAACREALEPRLRPVGDRADRRAVAARQLAGFLEVRRRLVDRIEGEREDDCYSG